MVDLSESTSNKSKIIIIASIIIVILLIVYLFFPSLIPFFTKKCGSEECFNNAAQRCRPAQLIKSEDGNTFEYIVRGKKYFFGDCLIYIKMREMSPGTAQDIKDLFENRGMICRIPTKLIPEQTTEMAKILDYCTGPLKEAMYELIIRKMYSMVSRELGSIVIEASKALRK